MYDIEMGVAGDTATDAGDAPDSGASTIMPLDARLPAAQLLMSEHPPLVVFDFDATLASCEISGTEDMDMLVRAFGGAERISLVDSTLSALRSAGATLAICSFNSKKTIIKTLGAQRIGLLHHFDVAHVHGFESFHSLPTRSSAYGDLYHKGHLLKELFLSGGLAPSRLCFVDDQHSNLRAVNVVAPGCRLVRACPSCGIGSIECEAILSWARGLGLQEKAVASLRDSTLHMQAEGGLQAKSAARTVAESRLPV
jgi:hypothetical protein